MRILLLDKYEKVFNVITDAIEAIEVQEINNAFTLNMTVKLSQQMQSDFERATYAGVPVTADEVNQFHLFTIQSFKNGADTIEVVGIEQAYDELQAYGYLKEYRLKDKPLSAVAPIIFSGTRWQLGHVDNVPISTVYIYYINRIEALKKVVAAFGLEAQFVYTIVDNTITKRTVNLYRSIGHDTGRRYVYGQNTIEVVREENRVELYTAAVGRGKGEEKLDENGNSTGGYGRKITFKDVVWSKNKGDPVNKPAGQEYVEIPEATAVWGYPDGSPRVGISPFDFDDETDPNHLLQITYEKLIDYARPKVQFSANVVDVGGVGLGDYVMVVRHDLNIKYRARAFKLTRNLLDETQNQVDIGDYLVKSQAEREDEMQDNLNDANDKIDDTNDKLDDIDEKVDDEAATRAEEDNSVREGANQRINDKLIYGPDKPDGEHEDGDTWFKSSGGLETGYPLTYEMYEYRDGDYRPAFPVGYDKVGRDIAEQNQKAADQVADDLAKQIADNKLLADKADVDLSAKLGILQTGVDTQFQQFTDGFNAYVKTTDGKLSQVTLGVDGVQSAISNLADNTSSRLTQLSDVVALKMTKDQVQALISASAGGVNIDLTNLKKDVASLGVTASGLQSQMTTAQGDISRFTQTASLLDNKITSTANNLSSQFTQQLNKITMSVSNGYLTMTGADGKQKSSIFMGADNIHITGRTYIDNAVIKSSMIESINAGKIVGGDIRGVNLVYLNNGVSNSVMSPGYISTTGNITSSVNVNTPLLTFGGTGVNLRADGGYKGWGLYVHMADGDHHIMMD